jgi:hypothetical protein
METYTHVILLIVVALLASFMGTIRSLLSMKRSTSGKELVRGALPHYD